MSARPWGSIKSSSAPCLEFKAQHIISYADCFAPASALELSATIVTGDSEFKKVAHLVEILWV